MKSKGANSIISIDLCDDNIFDFPTVSNISDG